MTLDSTPTPQGDSATSATHVDFESAESGRSMVEADLVLDRRYMLMEILGEGGMGQVHLAQHLMTGGHVAIKLIHNTLTASPRAVQRFEMEARHTAGLDHPNIVKVFDCGRDQGLVYLAMEYVEGQTLTSLIQDEGRLGWWRSVLILEQMLMALGEAHQHRLIHCDIKPGNVLLTNRFGREDLVKVVDFGIAHALSDTDSHAESIVGSPDTMAPEQWLQSTLSPATDLYAVGCVAFMMLSGASPFSGSYYAMGKAHTEHAPALDKISLSDIPSALVNWVGWLMRKSPASRPQSAAEALRALIAVKGGAARSSGSWPVHRPHLASTSTTGPLIVESPSVSDPAWPVFDTSFIGRQAQLERLDVLEAQGERLVTVHGPGGVGKSRLATHWQEGRRGQAGVYCHLSEARTKHDLCMIVARSLGVGLNKSDAVEKLGFVLAGRGAFLLLLDGFELLVDEAAEVLGAWLKMAPEGRFLVTSRQVLGIGGEVVVKLEPFDVPDPEVLMSGELAGQPALKLFVDRARSARRDFKLTTKNVGTVAKLATQLDGLPLALELAAAQCRIMTPAQILARLDARFSLLRASHRDGAARHGTLAATLDWSWDLLEPIEKVVLVQCAVFDGSFSLEAAEAVVDLSMFEGDRWVSQVLIALVDKSLLRLHGKGGRFSLLRSTRQHALGRGDAQIGGPIGELISAQQLKRGARDRHLGHFALYGREAFMDLLDQSGRAMRELAQEFENIRAALEYGMVVPDHHGDAAWCAQALGAYYKYQGPFGEGAKLIVRVLGTIDGGWPQRGFVLLSAAKLIYSNGDLKGGTEMYREALELAKAQGDIGMQSRCYSGLGYVLEQQGQLDASREHFAKSLETAREAGDLKAECWGLNGIGNVQWLRGDLDAAKGLFEHCLALSHKIGDKRNIAMANYGLGGVLRQQGRLEEAGRAFEACLEPARAVVDRRLEGVALYGLESILHEQGRFDEALEMLRSCLEVVRFCGDKWLEAWVLYALGSTHKDRGAFEQALETQRLCLTAAVGMNDKQLEGWIRCENSAVLLELGQTAEAMAQLIACAAVVESSQHTRVEGRLLTGYGKALQATGDRAEARVKFKEALVHAQSIKDIDLQIDALMMLAALDLEEGNLSVALGLLDKAHGQLGQGTAPRLLQTLEHDCLRALICALSGQKPPETAALDRLESRVEALGLTPQARCAVLVREIAQARAR